ncbi:hypothetical protein ABKA04_005575 [Annulohypoxylon sp. FPYF3050]
MASNHLLPSLGNIARYQVQCEEQESRENDVSNSESTSSMLNEEKHIEGKVESLGYNSKVHSLIPPQILKDLKEEQFPPGDIDSYLQNLCDRAFALKTEADEKAAAGKKAAEKAEWKRQIEEIMRIQADIDAKRRTDEARIRAEEISCVRFKDAVGRKFNFPYNLCRTWEGMEELIKQAFLHVDIIGPHVQAGHYDLIGPNGEIILPQTRTTIAAATIEFI